MVKQVKVSANKLAEFVYATPARKEAIVRERKHSTGFPQKIYEDASNFIPKFFGQQQDLLALEKKINQLDAKLRLHQTPKENPRITNSLGGLKALSKIAPLDLGPVTYQALPHNASGGLEIEGVFITVRPDALILKDQRGKKLVGAIKLHFPRTNPLGENGGKCVAAILNEYLEIIVAPDGQHRPSLCHAVDVFPGEIYTAPNAYKSIMKDIEAACRQYKLLWDSM